MYGTVQYIEVAEKLEKRTFCNFFGNIFKKIIIINCKLQLSRSIDEVK